jgi:iron complex outermembrane recepter protein
MRKFLLMAAATALAVSSLSDTAFAQNKVAASGELAEVIVTAEKREVNLQKVSTSIQVKEGADLRKTGKKRIDEIMQGTVGIQAQDSQVGVTFFVRGVDSSGGMGNVVAVPVLVDGVAQSRSESVRGGTLDLARAEIMRGPQSTTLGTNALAGAISLVSNKPVFEYQGSGSLTVGNYNLSQMEGVLNVPLSSNQAVRVAYSSEKRKGYISSGAGDSDLTNLRLKYRWQASDKVDVVATVSHQNIGGNGVQQGVLLASGGWVPVTAAAGLQFGHVVPAPPGAPPVFAVTPGQCAPNGPVTTMGCPATFYVVNNGVNFRQRSDAWNDGYPANSFPNGPFRDTNIDLASVELNWNTSIGTITLLPSVQKAHFRSKEPPRGTSWMEEDQKENTSIVDVRINSNPGGKLEWQVGAYYSYDKVYNGSFKGVNFPGAGGMGPPGTDPSDCTFSFSYCYGWDLTPKFDRTATNLNANLKYSLTDAVRLIGATRYNKDKASVIALSTVGGTVVAPNLSGPQSIATATVSTGARSWKKTTYRAGVEWDVRPGAMVYAVYNTGYNPGALDGMNTAGTVESTLKQSTLGWKSQLLDNRLQLNAELFVTTFYNRAVEGQLSAYLNTTAQLCSVSPFGGPTVQVANGSTGGFCAIVGQNTATVPQFQSKGVDFDATWLPTASDRVTVTVESLKAAYDQAPVITGNPGITPAALQLLNPGLNAANAATLSALLVGNIQGFVGQTLQNSPKLSGTLDYQHTFTLGNGSRLIPRLAAVYKQKYWSFGGAPGANVSQILADSNNPANLAWQQAYTKWDAYASWESADGKFTVTGFMKNIGDKVVLANYTDPYVSLEAPKTYGITFNANF